MPIKPISISLSPNTEKDDISLAFKLLFQCWRWKRGKAVKELEDNFKHYFGAKYAFSFNSGRTSLLALLKALKLERGSEVLLQAFTCNAAANPVLWSEMEPVYADCNEDDFNIDTDSLKKRITPKSKVLIVQHTFGIPADMDKVVDIAKENNLILIEDCAHSLGAKYDGKKLGTFGKAAFFSFSRDKIISSVYGGMVITNDDELAENIKKFQEEINYPSYFWIKQQLLHPVMLNFIILPVYNLIDLGKIILVLSQWIHILSKAVHWKEKRGEKPDYFPKRLPNAIALLALKQFKKLERFNNHREKIAGFYFDNLKGFDFPKISEKAKPVFLRLPVKNPRAHDIIRTAWDKENILIGDWYTSPIAPDDTKLDKMHYSVGTCPKAESLAKKTFNLPTHINISMDDAKRITDFLNGFK